MYNYVLNVSIKQTVSVLDCSGRIHSVPTYSVNNAFVLSGIYYNEIKWIIKYNKLSAIAPVYSYNYY